MKCDTHVNVELLTIKGHFFSHCSAIAPILPFLASIGAGIGISNTIIGSIYVFLPIAGFLSKYLFGFIADRYQIPKILFIGTEIVITLALSPINYIPRFASESQAQITCPNGVLQIDSTPKNPIDIPEDFLENLKKDKEEFICQIDCPNGFNKEVSIKSKNVLIENKTLFFHESDTKCTYESIVCDFTCNSNVMNSYMETRQKNTLSYTISRYQFWIFFLLMIVIWAGQQVLTCLSDSLCFAIIGDPELYGRQRLWGSIGWGSFALLGGFLVDVLSNDELNKTFTPKLIILLIMTSVDVFCSIKMKYVKPEKSPSILKDVKKVLLNIRVAVYLLWAMVVGMSTALFWAFLFERVTELVKIHPETLAYAKTINGLSLALRCFLGEMPMFYISSWIIKRLGTVNCMSVILLIDGLRLLTFAYVTNPWFVVPTEMINGVAFGLFYATLVSQASIISPTGTEATIQAIVGSAFEGIGLALGFFVSTQIVSRYNIKMAFIIFGLFQLFNFILHVIVQILIKKFKPLPESTDQTNQEPVPSQINRK